MTKKRCKQILCVVLSLILISGSIATFRPQNVEAATKDYVTNGGFETGVLAAGYSGATVVQDKVHGGQYAAKVTSGNYLQFTADGVNGGEVLPAGSKYVLSAWVYAETETEVKVQTNVWKSTWGDVQNSLVNTVKIPANQWTEIQLEISARDYDSIIQPQYMAAVDFYIDDITLCVVTDTVVNKYDFGLSFKEIDTGSNWMFNRSGVDTSVGQYFYFDAYVDGTEQRLWLEFTGEYTYIYSDVFNPAPTTSFRIQKGTAFTQYQSDGNSGLEKVEGGNTLYLQDTFYVVKTDAGWTTQTTIDLKPTGMRAETDNTWYVVLENDTILTGNYYKATILVDGEEQTVALQKYSAVNGLVIWSNFFYVIEAGTSVPQSSIEIPKGTKLYPIDPDKTGWSTVVAGDSYVISDSIKAVKYGDTWVTNPQTHDGSATPEYYNIDNGLTYQVNVSNNAYEIKKGSETITDTTLTKVGTYDITRVESGTVFIQKVVLYKTGDVNADNVVDVKDLVAIKKVVAQGATYDLAGMYAADMNRSDSVDAVDIRALRYQLTYGLSSSKGLNILNGKMPITGYDGPGYEYLTTYADTYSYIKDLGINLVTLNREQIGTSYDKAQLQLSEAEKNGIKVYLSNGYIYDKSNSEGIANSDGSVKEDRYREITAQYDGYRSFAGYYLYDEPFYNATVGDKYCLDDLKTALQALIKQTNVHGYLNLFPYLTQMNGQLTVDSSNKNILTKDSYQTYVKKASTLGAEFLSYDLYLRGNKTTTGWWIFQETSYEICTEFFYKNLCWMCETAAEEGKPYHAFIQVGTDFSSSNDKSTEQTNLTTVQEMYLEANVALAMGAKGLNYYSVVQPSEYAENEDKTYDYHRSGLLSANGEKNNGAGGANYEYYNAAKKINTYVDKIDEVLMNSENEAIIVTNDTVKGYLGDTVTSWNELSSISGNEMLVGCFNYYGKSAYLVVNITPDEGKTGSSKSVTLNFKGNPSYTYTGMDCVSHSGNDNTLSLTVPAGESVLVVMD